MKTKLATTLAAAATIAAPLVVQQQTLENTRAENLRLETLAAEAESLRLDNKRLAPMESLAREWTELRDNHQELLRLKDEIAALNAAAAEKKLQLAEQRNALQYQAERIASETEIFANVGSVQDEIIKDMKYMGLAARIYATENEDRLPESFEDIRAQLEKSGVASAKLDRYEFFPDFPESTMENPNLILFREKEPRRLPSGKWVRNYTLFDGSVQTRTMPTRDFSQWEAEQMERAKSQK